jgi:hypothetical protein
MQISQRFADQESGKIERNKKSSQARYPGITKKRSAVCHLNDTHRIASTSLYLFQIENQSSTLMISRLL